MPSGTVKWFNSKKGFGFILPDGGGADLFVHISGVENYHQKPLDEDMVVTYDLDKDRQGRTVAVNVRA